MDFKDFDTRKKSDEGVWIDIVSPDRTRKIAEFKVAGRDSKILRRRQQELAKKSQNKRKITAVEEEQDLIITLATCTLDWRMIDEDDDGKQVQGKDGVLVEAGEEIPVSFENAKAFYERWTFVAEQVAEAIADRSLFLAN